MMIINRLPSEKVRCRRMIETVYVNVVTSTLCAYLRHDRVVDSDIHITLHEKGESSRFVSLKSECTSENSDEDGKQGLFCDLGIAHNQTMASVLSTSVQSRCESEQRSIDLSISNSVPRIRRECQISVSRFTVSCSGFSIRVSASTSRIISIGSFTSPVSSRSSRGS